MCYSFLPFSIMGQILKKMQEDQGEAVVLPYVGHSAFDFPITWNGCGRFIYRLCENRRFI